MTRYRLLVCVKFSSVKHLQGENWVKLKIIHLDLNITVLINFFTTVNPVYMISDFHFGMSFVP